MGHAFREAKDFQLGGGFILDLAYKVKKTVLFNHGVGSINMHEFNLVDDGQRALMMGASGVPYDLGSISLGAGSGIIDNPVFQDIDVETGDVLFEWKALEHILPSVSQVEPPYSDAAWDWL
jgi:hypothetical protein